MKKFLLLCFMFVFACVFNDSWAQERTISGKVTSIEDGSTLPGVNVVLKGTTTGTVTDIDGNYTLGVPTDGGTLVFSFIGLATEEVEIGARSVVDVQMSSDVKQLSEVVVLGYGSQNKANISSSIAVVEAKTINEVPVASLDQVLQGQAAGLNVQTSSGQPGASGTILLRGRSSINGNVEPLFVIDGVPVDEDNFQSLNPNDIENVTILKDASASALYGSRGANGVIVVTTKNGEYNSGFGITYRNQFGFSELIEPNDIDFMNSQQLLEIQREAGVGEGAGLTDAEIADRALINTDWTDIFFQEGQTQLHELNIQTGNSTTTSYTTISYFEQEGTTRRSDLERISFRTNLQSTFNEKVTFGSNLTINYSKSNFPQNEASGQLDNPFLNPFIALPFQNPFNEDGSLNLVGDGTNGFLNSPFIALSTNELDIQERDELKVVGSTNIDVEVYDGINVGGSIGLDYNQRSDFNVTSPLSLRGDITPNVDATIKGAQSEQLRRDLAVNANAYIRYSKVFNNTHTIEVSAFTEFFNRRRENSGFVGFGIDPKLIGSGSGITPGTVTDTDDNGEPVYNYIPGVNSSSQEVSLLSYFGVAKYSYKDNFGGQVSIRRDGSSRFLEDERWGTFWSVSGFWNIHSNFFTGSSVLNQLKLRLSYGTAGNDRISGAFFGGLADGRTLYARGTGYENTPAVFPTQIGNPQIRWEQTAQANIGVDFALFDNRLTGTVDVYDKQTTDLFLNRPISLTSGFNSISSNIGELENRGIELTLSYDILNRGDFNINVNGNIAYNRNRINTLAGDDFIETGRTALAEGEPFGVFNLVRYAGVNPANGAPLYLDANGNVTETF
ncbi:MAG: SusC/RagA family TonB-linked outer membrane protein, partial [Bacteroidota bacterium]